MKEIITNWYQKLLEDLRKMEDLEDNDKQFTKLDLKDYKIKKTNGRALNKCQRLALEIIDWCGKSEYDKRWFRICKRSPAYVEAKFLELKRIGKKSGAYLWRMIFKKCEKN